MRRTPAAFAALTLGVVTAGLIPAQSAAASPPIDPGHPSVRAHRDDDRPGPLSERQRTLTRTAAEQVIKGTANVTTNKKGKKVVKLGKGKFVNYDVDRHEKVFTVLAEFGTRTKSPHGGTPGPLHNQIPQPDRVYDGSATDDNTTIWKPDFSRAHYLDLMFGGGESFRDFYLKQSNGRFDTSGDVSDWVTVPYNEARYGHNPVPGDGTSEAEGSWSFIGDSLQGWYAAQKAAGRSDAQIKSYLAQFDQVDRYDYDGDGDFNEPDGYIDHFQAIHAGEGEEAGGGAQGEDAIWSHRWYAYGTQFGKTGPTGNKAGGVQIGTTGLWVGDYTTEPENGGLGVFTHEFGHDLGLPDLYDTRGGDNGTGHWTLMSAGSWLGDGTVDIGSKPGYMGPWEKLQLGWLDVKTVHHGTNTRVKLGPADRDGRNTPQAIAVNLPDKKVRTDYNTPHSGTGEWWSGSDDDLNTTLSRTVDLTGHTTASLSAWVQHQIEEGYDFLHVEVSRDGGTTWTQVPPSLTGKADWTQRTWDLTPFAGSKVDVRFRYATDGAMHEAGAFIDDITITADGATLLSDDAESDNGWVAKGFSRIDGSVTKSVPQSYLAENRVYAGYDRYLRTGPYNFGWLDTRPDFVEHYPYQNGLLVWFQDGTVSDNNTSVHPGAGQSLPVDARPAPIVFPNGARLGNRRQPFDATFGLEATDPVTFHRNGVAVDVPSQPAIPTFDDSDPDRYWSAANPWNSTKVAGSGTRITVKSMSKQGDEMQVDVTFTK